MVIIAKITKVKGGENALIVILCQLINELRKLLSKCILMLRDRVKVVVKSFFHF